MIFSEEHVRLILAGEKTQTRRTSHRYVVGRTYTVQPGRGKPGIPEGRIQIQMRWLEWKEGCPSYPIWDCDADAEGGYTPAEYECLYERLNPGWTERWAYIFTFIPAEEAS